MIQIKIGKHEYYHRRKEIIKWCEETFGEKAICATARYEDVFNFNSSSWFYYEMFGNGEFTFKNEQDAVLFKLTWVGTDDLEEDFDI